MTRSILITMMAAAPLFLGACGGEAKTDKPAAGTPADKPADKPEADKPEPEAAPDLDPQVAQAVAIADAIAKEPGEADAILEKNGMDREKLDQLMAEIAKDPAKASAYKLARAE